MSSAARISRPRLNNGLAAQGDRSLTLMPELSRSSAILRSGGALRDPFNAYEPILRRQREAQAGVEMGAVAYLGARLCWHSAGDVEPQTGSTD